MNLRSSRKSRSDLDSENYHKQLRYSLCDPLFTHDNPNTWRPITSKQIIRLSAHPCLPATTKLSTSPPIQPCNSLFNLSCTQISERRFSAISKSQAPKFKSPKVQSQSMSKFIPASTSKVRLSSRLSAAPSHRFYLFHRRGKRKRSVRISKRPASPKGGQTIVFHLQLSHQHNTHKKTQNVSTNPLQKVRSQEVLTESGVSCTSIRRPS